MEPKSKGNIMDIEVDKIVNSKRKSLLNIQVSTPFDVKMFQYMITRCALLLRSYKTTLEEDQTLLKQIKVGSHSQTYFGISQKIYSRIR